MTIQHLTDETLQAFLLKETQDDAVSMHLAVCSACRIKLENYQHLVVGIQKVAPESFAFDVTTLVMDRVVQYEKQESRKQELVFWAIMTILLIGISSFAIPFIPQILTIFSSTPVFSMLFVVGTGLAVFVFLFADLSKQYKQKERQIFGNKLQPMF